MIPRCLFLFFLRFCVLFGFFVWGFLWFSVSFFGGSVFGLCCFFLLVGREFLMAFFGGTKKTKSLNWFD